MSEKNDFSGGPQVVRRIARDAGRGRWRSNGDSLCPQEPADVPKAQGWAITDTVFVTRDSRGSSGCLGLFFSLTKRSSLCHLCPTQHVINCFGL
jgi:hypothetical protein